MRLFVAIPLPSQMIGALNRVIGSLKAFAPQARWVRPEDAHWTLAFLGPVDEGKSCGIAEAMKEAARSVEPFILSLGEAGAFPDWRKPRVVWLGAREGAGPMGRLADSLRQELARRDFALEDRPFHAHLTLCRLRVGAGAEQLREASGRWASYAGEASLSMRADTIALVSSRLTSRGPVYTVVGRQPLGASA